MLIPQPPRKNHDCSVRSRTSSVWSNGQKKTVTSESSITFDYMTSFSLGLVEPSYELRADES